MNECPRCEFTAFHEKYPLNVIANGMRVIHNLFYFLSLFIYFVYFEKNISIHSFFLKEKQENIKVNLIYE